MSNNSEIGTPDLRTPALTTLLPVNEIVIASNRTNYILCALLSAYQIPLVVMWFTYSKFLPALLARAGKANIAPILLTCDQAIAMASNILFALFTDYLKSAYKSSSYPIAIVGAVSSIFFLAAPAAGGDATLAFLIIWQTTSSILRGPPQAVLADYAPHSFQQFGMFLLTACIGVGNVVNPFVVTSLLEHCSAEAAFVSNGVVLFAGVIMIALVTRCITYTSKPPEEKVPAKDEECTGPETECVAVPLPVAPQPPSPAMSPIKLQLRSFGLRDDAMLRNLALVCLYCCTVFGVLAWEGNLFFLAPAVYAKHVHSAEVTMYTFPSFYIGSSVIPVFFPYIKQYLGYNVIPIGAVMVVIFCEIAVRSAGLSFGGLYFFSLVAGLGWGMWFGGVLSHIVALKRSDMSNGLGFALFWSSSALSSCVRLGIVMYHENDKKLQYDFYNNHIAIFEALFIIFVMVLGVCMHAILP